MLTSQRVPVNPTGHTHMYSATPSTHVAPFRQGDEAHSAMFISHNVPVWPAWHIHVKDVPTDWHVDAPRHGLLKQWSTTELQIVPVNPVDEQSQVNCDTKLEHTPPFRHGDDAHSSMSTEQRPPVKPATHEQANPSTPSAHVAPFWHGDDTHSSMFSAQVKPVNPAAQLHIKDATPSEQTPSF